MVTRTCAFRYDTNRAIEQRNKGDICNRPIYRQNRSGLCHLHANAGSSKRWGSKQQ